MGNRNPNKPHRHIERNERKTLERIEQYNGIKALLQTWETQPDQVQADNHDYIIHLRARERTVKNYLLHRADANVNI